MNLVRTGLRLINLIDENNRPQSKLQRFANNEFRLRHRAFGGIHQNNHPIDHTQNSLNLAAEVRMSRRVDDIDTNTFPFHGGAFSLGS